MSQDQDDSRQPERDEKEPGPRDSTSAAVVATNDPSVVRDVPSEPAGRSVAGKGRPDRPDREPATQEPAPAAQEPSMMKNLLMTAVVGLLSGVVGAAGYTHFFGAKPEESGSAEKKPATASKEAPEKGKSAFSGTQSVNESNARTASSIPGFTASDDADTLKKQIASLMERIDGLSGRIDQMSRPKDETPPVLHTMQIKMGELARVMDDVASLPAKVRHYDNRLESMQEEIKSLRSRIESSPGGRGEVESKALPSQPKASAPTASEPAESPSMALGVTLLERGEYASAREVFLRLELADPRDARVWYLGSLATGMASGKWDGEAMRFAEKGIERERAGTPPSAEIDTLLATRSSIKGVPWLNSLRRKSLEPNRAP